MGVLDELKQQAANAKAEQEKKEKTELTQRAALEQNLLRRINELYGYFREFQQQLNVVKPEVTGDFYLTDLCTLNDLRQQGYRVTADDDGVLRKFSFHYDCKGRGAKEVKLPNSIVAEQKKERLKRCNLKFRVKEHAAGRCSLFIDSLVPVSFEFKADVDRAAIRLKVRNKPMLGASNYTYDADEVNAEFMDEVAKYILDKPNRFDELSGNTIPEDTLTRIRQQLKKDRRREPAPARPGLKDRLTRQLFGRKI